MSLIEMLFGTQNMARTLFVLRNPKAMPECLRVGERVYLGVAMQRSAFTFLAGIS